MGLPKTGGTEWAGPQATPWTGVNDAHRRLDALASRAIVVDRDLTAPPVSCDDGANYLVAAAATGLWDTRDGQLATAVGADAVNGWLFQAVEVQGYRLSVQDEAVELEYDGAAWVDVTTGGGGGTWGTITGTLSAQTDLQAALDAKAAVSDIPFTIGTGFEETPTASYVIARYTFAEDIDFADDFSGAQGNIGTNPTSSFVIDVAVNGSPVGTITISTGGVFTFATTGGALSCLIGDEILFTAPATPDATAAGSSFTLKGTR